MKERQIRSIVVWHKVISLSLALMLISLTALQALHVHTNSIRVESGGDHSAISAVEKCAICDYLANHQGKQAYLSHPLVPAPLARPVTLLFIAYAGSGKSTVQDFTNKGPPITASQAAS